MQRTIPSTASDEIELYLRTVYSLLRSTTEVQIRTLEETHGGMNSSLHPDARKEAPDISAFIYSMLRLPDNISDASTVLMGQSYAVFAQHGYKDVSSWRLVTARARRRRTFFNRSDTLACFIASRSDIDDLVPSLTAYQMEWNKLHFLLQRIRPGLLEADAIKKPGAMEELADALLMALEDLARLKTVWDTDFLPMLSRIAHRKLELRVRLLSGSLSEYWRATRAWWDNIEMRFPDLLNRPVYFVSSNPHSMVNVLIGFALQHRAELVTYLDRKENADLKAEWQDILERCVPSSVENFLYYVLKKYQQSRLGRHMVDAQRKFEESHGISRIPGEHSFELEAQVIELARLPVEAMDPRLSPQEAGILRQSDALILNVDYPLGMGAYNLLAKVAEHSGEILGVYIMGKAATLNGVRGDVMIPNVVFDEHSDNTYLFPNAFSASDVAPYLIYGTVLDNQKAVSVMGTFLQNSRVMDVIYRDGYTDIEMEAGPYLSAVYEMYRPQRHPVNEIVNLYGLPFDVGILHYASDTPLGKGKNLGAGTLSYFGMDCTYATTVAILRRIIQKEGQRLKG